MLAAVSCSEAACCSVRCDRLLLPAAICCVADAIDSDERRISPIVLCRRPCIWFIAAIMLVESFARTGRMVGLTAQAATYVADDQHHRQRNHRADHQHDGQVPEQRFVVGRIDIADEHAARDVPVPRRETHDVADLRHRGLAVRQAAAILREAVAGRLRRIDDRHIQQLAVWILEIADRLAGHRQRRMHQHDRLRIHHEQITGFAVTHRRETGERFALRVGLAHLAVLRQAVIPIDDALRRLDEIHHAGLALGEHRAARFDRAP